MLCLSVRSSSSPPRHPSLTPVFVVVIILALTVTVLIVKLRQRRKRSAPSRRRRNYSRTSDELVAAPEQPYEHVWRGPYASRASYTRSPSPVSKLDVTETPPNCVFPHTLAAVSPPRHISLRRISGLNPNGDMTYPDSLYVYAVFFARAGRGLCEYHSSRYSGGVCRLIIPP